MNMSNLREWIVINDPNIGSDNFRIFVLLIMHVLCFFFAICFLSFLVATLYFVFVTDLCV